MDSLQRILDNIWNGWIITDLIGAGAFGKVFRIERREFSNVYTSALKVLEVPHSQEEVASARSQGMSKESMTSYFYGMVEDVVSEITLMSKLQGISNIVSYQDHAVVEKEGEFGWLIFIRMELLTKLNDILMSESLYKNDGIKIGIDICKALEVCERNKIIHRDIKPENIFRSDQGDYKLGDFGIARQMEKTAAGTKTGTYSYMAPEVYNRQPYNMTADIYSLGILLYRLFNNGRFPFLPSYPEAISYFDKEKADLKRLAGEEMPDPCNADSSLSYVIKKACAYNPKDRYSSADELAQDLKKLLYDDTGGYELNQTNGRLLNPESEVDSQKELISTEEATVTLDTSTLPMQEHNVVNTDEHAVTEKNGNSTTNDRDRLHKNENGVMDEKGKNPRLGLVLKGLCAVVALICVLIFAFKTIVHSPNHEPDISLVTNYCVKDISGILYQICNRFEKDELKSTRVYELSLGTYGYVIQTKNADDVQYSFILPTADDYTRGKVTDKTDLYEKSLQAGVLYLMQGMNMSEPKVPDSIEGVMINSQSFTLSKITLQGCPEIIEGFPAVAYLITDNKNLIRRIMILTADGFLVRTDYTYDSDDRVIKSHWTSVYMDKEQWQKLGWYSTETNSMIISPTDIDVYVKDMIVKLPKDFVGASPSGKNSDSNTIILHDENGLIKGVDYRNTTTKKHIVWKFTNNDNSREKAVREWTDSSTSETKTYHFVYERDKDGLINKVICDEDFFEDNEPLGVEGSEADGFKYSYNDDGTMNIEKLSDN